MKSLLITLILLIALSLNSCGSAPKLAPEHKGVDPRVKSLVDEYMWLSKQNNITFSRPVTIGFKKLGLGDTVGTCTYGGFWREIDIDIDYWENNDHFTRLALVYHELTHCYCGRDHDWAEDRYYPKTAVERLEEAMQWLSEGGPRPGRYEDGCPTSLMFPTVVDKDCISYHYHDYITEMFERCRPW